MKLASTERVGSSRCSHSGIPESNKLILFSIFNGIALIGCAVFLITALNSTSQADVSASTALPISKGGTSADNPTDARQNLGLGSLATQNNIALGSDVTGVLPVGNGGTGRDVLHTYVDLSDYKGFSGFIRSYGRVVMIDIRGTATSAIAASETMWTIDRGYRVNSGLSDDFPRVGNYNNTLTINDDDSTLTTTIRSAQAISNGSYVRFLITYVGGYL
ncbi:hypothetical protein FACS189431_1930 [Alphaproteobacteria bacterium]|nr:hypothetical protein FACS189431_1930 [Alphaproteobacteria bacterium]